MAQLTSFSFRPGRSLLHRMDARFKLLCMLLLSMASLNSSFLWLFLLSLPVLALLNRSGVRLLQTAKELKIFALFLFFIILSRSLQDTGISDAGFNGPDSISVYGAGNTILFSWWIFEPTLHGLLEGVRFSWRLLLVVLLSLGFISTSKTGEIKGAVEFYLGWVPFIPEKRVSTMLSLLLRFIPLIFTRIQQTSDAQKARCIEARKNPYYRLVKLTLPTLRRIFRDGELLAVAMTARCYCDERTGPVLQASRLDYVTLLVVVSFVFLRWLV